MLASVKPAGVMERPSIWDGDRPASAIASAARSAIWSSANAARPLGPSLRLVLRRADDRGQISSGHRALPSFGIEFDAYTHANRGAS